MSRRERLSRSSTTDTAGASSRTPPPSSASETIPRRAAPPCYDGTTVTRALPRSRPTGAFKGVKVFSATKFADRDPLGDVVTHWLAGHPEFDIVDMKVTQSSDAGFHCVTISVFYLEASANPR